MAGQRESYQDLPVVCDAGEAVVGGEVGVEVRVGVTVGRAMIAGLRAIRPPRVRVRV